MQPNIFITPGNSIHYPAIWQLHEDLILDVQRLSDRQYVEQHEQTGFLLSSGQTQDDFCSELREATVLKVALHQEKVVGFLLAKYELYFPPDAPNIEWLDPGAKLRYQDKENSCCLHFIAVSPEYHHQGIAKKLFQAVEKELLQKGKKSLFSIVDTAPVKNTPSLAFHQSQGFTPVCHTHPMDLFGVHNLESILFEKKL